MTLLDLILAIESAAGHQSTIQQIAGDELSKLDNLSEAECGVFAFSQGKHAGGIEMDTVSYVFSFYYIDRLNASMDNHLEIQSTGIVTLTDILKELSGMGISVLEYTFEALAEEFVAGTAGVRCDVVLDVFSDAGCSESL